MIIKVKNVSLFHLWLSYYEPCTHMIPAEKRTMAFINSSKNERPPLYW